MNRKVLLWLTATALATACGDDGAETAGAGQSHVTPIHFTVVVHLEGWPVHQQNAFLKYAQRIRQYADQVEAIGGTFTWETSKLIPAMKTFDDNVLLELQQRGHGIGVHADLGGQASPGGGYSQVQFTADLKALKDELSQLGVNAQSVSGICSQLDWVSAAADAGFDCANGHIGYCTQSLGSVYMPDGYADCASPSDCHRPYPDAPAEQVHPWHAANGQTWTQQDGAGRLWLIHSVGAINCAAEDRASAGPQTDCEPADAADVNAIMLNLEQTFAHVDDQRFNAVVMHWSFGMELDDNVFQNLLDRIDPYIRSGRLKWSTLGATCEAAF